jgi:hypothetical protein
MALYSIESEQCLGMAHFGGAVTVNGESAVELSDEEVDILVQLIKEKDTTDVDELDIATSHPSLYEKLDNAYREMAYDAEELHWLWEGYNNGYFEYDEEELMNYCESELDFKFEYDIKKYYLDDPEDLEEGEEPDIDEDQIEEDKYEAFSEWLDDYVNGLSDKEAKSFFYNHMNADLDMDNVAYSVEIPAGIIKKALG